jgi:hypothetical protein
MSRQDRAPMKQAEQVGKLLKQVLGDKGMDDRLSRYQAWLIWDKVVGEQIAQRARPLRFRQGVLEVQVDHPVWMQQLQMLKPKILEKLNQQLPNADITDIYLRKAPTPYAKRETTPEPEPPKWQQIELTEEEKQQIEKQLETLDNPELRAEMRRFFSLQKRLDKGREEEN